MRKLGGFYENKLVDYVLAHMWFNLAAANGDKKGVELREMVAKDMTFPQIEEAQNLSRECVENDYKGCGEKKPWWKYWD